MPGCRGPPRHNFASLPFELVPANGQPPPLSNAVLSKGFPSSAAFLTSRANPVSSRSTPNSDVASEKSSFVGEKQVAGRTDELAKGQSEILEEQVLVRCILFYPRPHLRIFNQGHLLICQKNSSLSARTYIRR